MHESWHFLVDLPQWKENFKLLNKYRNYAHPSPIFILNPFQYPVEDISVVIPQEFPFDRKVSNGFAYGSLSEIQVTKYLYNELYIDYQESLPFDPGALETKFTHFWGHKLAEQGVFLWVMNLGRIENQDTVLDWSEVCNAILEKVLLPKEHLVWLLWGKSVWKLSQNIPDSHAVFKTAKPTSLTTKHSFLGSRPFTSANTYLEENKLTPIQWVIVNQ